MLDLTKPIYIGCLYVQGTNVDARVDDNSNFNIEKVDSAEDKNGFKIRVCYCSSDSESSWTKTYNSDGLHKTDNSTIHNYKNNW